MLREPFTMWSSYGEDGMLYGIMDRLCGITGKNQFPNISYIDIGCYHPMSDNNTYFLYKAGWRGTIVDPNPNVKAQVEIYRKDDLYLELAVATEPGEQEFYMFTDAHSCNTLDKDFADMISKVTGQEVQKTIKVQCKTLDEIFDIHIDKYNNEPTILKIDIEGLDYDVISSYSFKYRPVFIMLEDELLGAFNNSKILQFMAGKNYKPVCSNFLSTLYMDTDNELYSTLFKLGNK
jgi:FkbM family methyltransferase